MIDDLPTRFRDAYAALVAGADQADAAAEWPRGSWQALSAMGALRWLVPAAYGGLDLPAAELLAGYEQLARACLTSCFILSQRDAAVRRLVSSGNAVLCERLLPPLVRGETSATVGIAQITTSRQHTRPAMAAALDDRQIRLDGTMPWVTGAARADYIITGAVVEDGRQVLVVLPTKASGVVAAPALDLMALQGSGTALVRCDGAVLDRHWLLAGPAERVLAGDAAGGLTTSCLALGLAHAATDYLRHEAKSRPEYSGIAERVENRRQALWQWLLQEANVSSGPDAASALRAQANQCVLQATQAALTISKGTGFVRPHPAQRWARQALFFLVWSCPRPTAEAVLEWLVPMETKE